MSPELLCVQLGQRLRSRECIFKCESAIKIEHIHRDIIIRYLFDNVSAFNPNGPFKTSFEFIWQKAEEGKD